MVDVVEAMNCPNCGAPLQVTPGEIVVTCQYCGSDHKMLGDRKFVLKHSIIPSRYDSDGMSEIVRSWMGSGFYKPDDLLRKAKILSIQATVLPFYLSEVNAKSTYSGILERTGTRQERSGVLEKKYYWKILARRASKFPVREYQIPLEGKTQFNLAYMPKGGKFLNAEVDLDDAIALTKQEVEANQRYLLANEVDDVTSMSTEFEISDTEFLHAPVWEVEYEYRGKLYEMLICGASGDIVKADIPQKPGFF